MSCEETKETISYFSLTFSFLFLALFAHPYLIFSSSPLLFFFSELAGREEGKREVEIHTGYAFQGTRNLCIVLFPKIHPAASVFCDKLLISWKYNIPVRTLNTTKNSTSGF